MTVLWFWLSVVVVAVVVVIIGIKYWNESCAVELMLLLDSVELVKLLGIS